MSANEPLIGEWSLVGTTKDVDAFTPEAKLTRNSRMPYNKIRFKKNGRTDTKYTFYDNDMLLNMRNNVALRMTPKTLDGTRYLFLEVGNFNERKRESWPPTYYVLKRVK